MLRWPSLFTPGNVILGNLAGDIMTTMSELGSVRGVSSGSKAPFPANHPWDRNFFLLWIGLAWVGILGGFVPEMIKHVQGHEQPYPVIVHFHAAAFVGWLVLFTAQILLIRANNRPVHRKLGYGMLAIAVSMAFLGPMTALIVGHRDIGTPAANPGFLSIQFTDIAAFVGLTAAAVTFRNSPATHKRLMLLGTLYITDAGFGRIALAMKVPIHGPLDFWAVLYAGSATLILGLGAYDLVTRRRLHPAYLAGAGYAFALQATAVILFGLPAWKALATKIIAAV